jgi:rhodanese-related sulfurtransferase
LRDRGGDGYVLTQMTRPALLSTALLLAGGLAAAAQPEEKFRLIEVAELESMQKDARAPVTVLDANDAEVREKSGVIPGAKLLSSFNRYDIQKELPADRNAPLVFYCSSRL